MNTILAALVNGAILGTIVTAFVWFVLRVAPRRVLNAATRYAIWWSALAVTAALPALYAPLPQFHFWPHAIPLRPGPAPVWTVAPVADVQPAGLAQHSPPATPVITSPPIMQYAKRSQRPHAKPFPWPFPIRLTAEVWPKWILATWSLVSMILLLRLTLSCVLLRRTSARASDAPAPLRAQARTWLALCGSTRRGIRLASSTEISIPVAVGPLHPSILIPARLLDELEPCDLDQIGLHETAHLARGDDYALLVQRIVEAVFALHPAVRWIARQIDLEREIACDDFVVAATGHARSYATCLTRMVEMAGGVGSSLACASAADDRSHLSRRVDMLLDKTRHTSTRLLRARLTAMIAVLAALGWIAGKTPGLVAFAKPLARIVWRAPLEVVRPAMAAQVATPQNAAQDMDGRVIEDASGDPLASAELRFHQAGMRELAADLDTDREGRFRVSGLPAGDYTVDISKPNFVTTTLRLRVPAPSLHVRLVRHGVITGHVADAEGVAVPGVIRAPGGRTIGGARITVLVKSAQGELKQVRETELQDGGEYRVFDLPPGQYAIGLWYDGLKDGSGVQLYPDTAHPRFFTVAGGEEYPGVDFTILPHAAYQVSGTITLPKPGMHFALALGLPGQPALPIAQTMTEDDGSFRFERIPAGAYDLFAGGPAAGYGAHDTVLGPEPLFGRMHVQVGGQNIEGLAIPMSAGRSLTMLLHAQGSGKPPAGCPQSASVSLVPLEPWGLMLRDNSQANFAQEQTIKNLAPGRFRLSAVGLGAGCYQANQPVVDLNGDVPNAVAIELAAAGSIHGTLRAGSVSATDFAVVLLDAESNADDAAQLAFPDAQGRFDFEGLRPGRYRIAAQPAAEASRTRWISDVSRMVEIDVHGGSPTSLELPVALPKGDRQ